MYKNFKDSVFNIILNDYYSSDGYKRAVAMNILHEIDIIPVLDEYSEFYDAGLRYIKELDDAYPSVYDIYVDVIFLFSDFYRKWRKYFNKITVISNEFNLSNRYIYYYHWLSFDIDMSGFIYLLGQNTKLHRDNILNLINSNISLKYNTDKVKVFLSFWNLDESIIPSDIEFFNYLISFISSKKESPVYFEVLLDLPQGDVQYYTSRLLKGLSLNDNIKFNFIRKFRNHSRPKFKK